MQRISITQIYFQDLRLFDIPLVAIQPFQSKNKEQRVKVLGQSVRFSCLPPESVPSPQVDWSRKKSIDDGDPLHVKETERIAVAMDGK